MARREKNSQSLDGSPILELSTMDVVQQDSRHSRQ